MTALTPRKFAGDKIKKQINVRFHKSGNLNRGSNYDGLTCFTSLDLKLLIWPPLKQPPPHPKLFLTVLKGNLMPQGPRSIPALLL